MSTTRYPGISQDINILGYHSISRDIALALDVSDFRVQVASYLMNVHICDPKSPRSFCKTDITRKISRDMLGVPVPKIMGYPYVQ